MKIYVESRGYSPDFEYCWQPEVPSQLRQLSRLIQSDSPSLVLARLDSKLILLITGLESSDKRDWRDRPIRYSITWVCNDNFYDEKQIRGIAVHALRESLSNEIDKYISFGGSSGFEAELSKIKELSQSFGTLGIGESDIPSLEQPRKIAKNSQVLREDLAYMLERYRLPKQYNFLVVVTGIKSEESLKEAQVWRGLSNLVKSENWKDISEGEAHPPNFPWAAMTITVVVVAALILLLVLALR